jgi:SAM-dependent methyltransferase
VSNTSVENQTESHYTLVNAPKPKPSDAAIREMVAQYYDALSRDFDQVNSEQSFGSYLNAINTKVATSLGTMEPLNTVLSIGSGTGAREIAIRDESGRSFDVVCVDASERMSALARAKGLSAVHSTFADFETVPDSFDAVLFLNAFEVLTSEEERLASLHKIRGSLRAGGRLFIDAMDIENKNDSWAERVKEQHRREGLAAWGYDSGDCFCRRSDQDLTVFAHYSNREEMERLLTLAGFRIQQFLYVAEESGVECAGGEGQLFFIAESIDNIR